MSKSVAVLTAVLGITVVVETAYIASVRRRVDDMQGRLDRMESRQRDVVRREEVARLEENVESVRTQMAQSKRMAPPSDPAAARTEEEFVPLTVHEINDLIEKKVDEKVKARQGEDNGWGGKKRPLADVAKELLLDKEVEKQMAFYANEGKQQVFDILKTPRTDGTNLVDDIVAAMKGENSQERMQEQFMRIFKENVPGTQETYFAAALRISEDVQKNFGRILTPDQMTSYKHTGVGPLDLETGFDPWAEYMKGK